MDTKWTEMHLSLNANIKGMPHEIPSTSPNSSGRYLGKSFTTRDDELASAEHFLYPVDVGHDTDNRMSEAEKTDHAT